MNKFPELRSVASGLFLAVLHLSACPITSATEEADDVKMWYMKPADVWVEALPVGSGRLGAMVFGGTSDERIQFNEDTLWTGKPHNYVREGAGGHLRTIQRMVFDGKVDEAAVLIREKFLSDPVRQKAYQPFG